MTREFIFAEEWVAEAFVKAVKGCNMPSIDSVEQNGRWVQVHLNGKANYATRNVLDGLDSIARSK